MYSIGETYCFGHHDRDFRHPDICLVEVLDSTFSQCVIPEAHEADSTIGDNHSVCNLVPTSEMRTKLITGEVWWQPGYEDPGVWNAVVVHAAV
jgi:hypothetical protein